MPKLRYQPPERIIGATDCSQHPLLRGSLNVVRLVKKESWVWDGLRKACELEVKYARKRDPGCWELVAVAFVVSGYVDVRPWYDETTDELWKECEFDRRPARQTVDRRLRELGEKAGDEFLSAAALVIQRCRAHDERVMAHVHVDCTEDETHAALVHDCQPGEECGRAAAAGAAAAGGSAHGPALRPPRATTGEARERREKWNEEDPADSESSAKAVTPKTMTVLRDGRRIKRVRLGKDGCWYRTRDVEAGVRAYTGGGRVRRFWHGYYNAKAIDGLTGGVVPLVESASTQEYDLFPALMERVCRMADKTPETVIGDKGFSVEKCFEYATRNGIAPVFPRRRYGDGRRHDKESHDRDGVMRCKHCGGTMSQIKYSKNHGKPRLWFRCASGATPDCARDQTITCATDWRSLVPLARTEPLFHELLKSHRTYEAVHDYWRDRYRVGADNLANRPKAIGIGGHRLRASVACFVDWLRIASINNWLAEPPENPVKGPRGERAFMERAVEAAKAFVDRRARVGLCHPYGPRAKSLGIGKETPPSERAASPPGS
jgi:hypothetical protein